VLSDRSGADPPADPRPAPAVLNTRGPTADTGTVDLHQPATPARPSDGADTALRRILDAAGIPAAALDLEGRMTSVNPAFARACGRGVGELVGLHVLSLCPGSDQAGLLAAVIHVVGGVTAVERSDLRVVAADGSVRELVLTLGSEPGADGRPVAVHAVAEDVTLRRRQERRRERLAEPTAGGTGEADGATSPLSAALVRSARSGAPVALLECLVERREGTGDPGALPEPMVVEAVAERLRQRLRPDDTVTVTDRGRISVVAEELGDVQDAAGVAYRLLAAVVEPVRSADRDEAVELTVGVAVGDAGTPLSALRSAAFAAADEARRDGRGTFRLHDCRSTPV
jgi:PAS domain S-box-containing protein